MTKKVIDTNTPSGQESYGLEELSLNDDVNDRNTRVSCNLPSRNEHSAGSYVPFWEEDSVKEMAGPQPPNYPKPGRNSNADIDYAMV